MFLLHQREQSKLPPRATPVSSRLTKGSQGPYHTRAQSPSRKWPATLPRRGGLWRSGLSTRSLSRVLQQRTPAQEPGCLGSCLHCCAPTSQPSAGCTKAVAEGSPLGMTWGVSDILTISQTTRTASSTLPLTRVCRGITSLVPLTVTHQK